MKLITAISTHKLYHQVTYTAHEAVFIRAVNFLDQVLKHCDDHVLIATNIALRTQDNWSEELGNVVEVAVGWLFVTPVAHKIQQPAQHGFVFLWQLV